MDSHERALRVSPCIIRRCCLFHLAFHVSDLDARRAADGGLGCREGAQRRAPGSISTVEATSCRCTWASRSDTAQSGRVGDQLCRCRTSAGARVAGLAGHGRSA